MGTKKLIGLISLIVVVLVVSIGAGVAIGYSSHKFNANTPTVKTERVTKESKVQMSSSSVSKQENISLAKSTSTVTDTVTRSAKTPTSVGNFDSLSQKEQLAVLINHHFGNDPYLGIPYWPYMGSANKIVMTWDGAGASLNRAFLITDNHDGTFSYSNVDTSADFPVYMGPQNSYWKAADTVSKTTLFLEYKQNKTTIDSLVDSLDMSKSSQVFTYLPVDQDTMPANASDDDDDFYDDEDDTYDDSDEDDD